MENETRVIEDNFDAFNDYAMRFNLNDKMIEYKYNHCYRVMSVSEIIAKSLNLNKDDIYLAMLIGLLHDIGRFEQWTKLESFNDNRGIDHSDLAIKILFKDKLIKKFAIGEEDYDVIKKAVEYHNDYSIEQIELTEREKMFCKIIRDADKLDILYAFSYPRLLELNEDDEEISEEVKVSFYEYKSVKNEYIKNKSDRILSLLQLTFDLYYDKSFEILKEKDYYGKIYENLKNKSKFNIYFETLDNYINERCKNVRK